MKATELMIGDWVQIAEPCKYAGAIGRVKTLIDHKDDENAYFKVFLKNNTIHIGIEDICSDDIRPIPLTPEILEKNGFSCKGHDHYHFEWRDHYVLAAYPRFGGSTEIFFQSYKMKYRGVIRFVHQLQQALMFCEIEKEIVL